MASDSFLGVLFGLSAALGFGSSAVLARLSLQHMRTSTGVLISLVVGTVITLALAFSFHTREILSLSGIAFVWFLLAGLINFPLGRLLNFTGVGMVGVSRASPIVGASPLFATIMAVTVGGETVTVTLMIGIVAIIGGLALVLRNYLKI